MGFITKYEESIPYLTNGNNKVILDFSINQHQCRYYIDIWDVLCGAIQAANNMVDFPYKNTLFAVGVKLKEGKSYSVILTKYNLYVLGFADFYEGPEIPSNSDVIIFEIEDVAYPMKSPKINIKDADILISQFQNMYYFWEQIKNNQSNKNPYRVFTEDQVNGQPYFISFLVVVWFISEAAREETGRIAWLMNLKRWGMINDTIVGSIPWLTDKAVMQSIWEKCLGLFTWGANRHRIFTNWKQIANAGTTLPNYITVQNIAKHFQITSNDIVQTLKSIFEDR